MLALGIALGLLLPPADAQFIETYARSVFAGEQTCACRAETPCQHIASTIVQHTLGYGSVQCKQDSACPVWDAASNKSLAGKHFFFCCAGAHTPLASCEKKSIQVVVRETLPQSTTTTTASVGIDAEESKNETAELQTQPLILQVAGSDTLPVESGQENADDAPCDVVCILGISIGAGAFLLLALLFTLHRRHKHRAELATVERDLSDLQKYRHFPGPPIQPQPVYEEISEAETSAAEYAYDLASAGSAFHPMHYEEPVPVAARDTPKAFHNPLYGGPFPTPKCEEEEEVYANPNAVPVYDLGEEVEA